MSEEILCSRILRDGGELIIKRAAPPLSEKLINVFLRTPELSATRNESRMRLFGALRNQSSDCFLIGELNGRVAGTLWYCTPSTCKEIAYMGEVFTAEKQRGRGIATSLLGVAVDIFRRNGGRAIYITNLCPRAPHDIYRKLGFKAYGYGQHAYGGIIRLTLDEGNEDFDQSYYRYDPNTCIREVNWGDLPHFISLLNHPHPWIVRAYNFGLIGHTVFDELGKSFMNFMKTLKRGNVALALETNNHRVVGTAYSASLQSASQSHVKTVDIPIHPNYYGEAARLMRMLIEKLCDRRNEKLQAYAAATDKSKIKILTSSGFEREATMKGQLKVGTQTVDLEVYSCALKESLGTSYYPLEGTT